jgi:hypothetical protein
MTLLLFLLLGMSLHIFFREEIEIHIYQRWVVLKIFFRNGWNATERPQGILRPRISDYLLDSKPRRDRSISVEDSFPSFPGYVTRISPSHKMEDEENLQRYYYPSSTAVKIPISEPETKPVQKPVHKPVEKPVQKPVEKPVHKPERSYLSDTDYDYINHSSVSDPAIRVQPNNTTVPESKQTKSSDEILRDRLSLYGLKEKTRIKGDGNCQFASIADQLFDDPDRHPEVRKKAVEWLKDNKNYKLPNSTSIGDYLQTEFFPYWSDYIDYMSQESIWGDHFTLLAIAEVYKIRIVIVSSMEVDPGIDPITVITPTNSWNNTVYISHLHELHYSSLCLDESP